MGIAIFLAFFGCTGFLLLRSFPELGFLTLVPAILVSIWISNMFKAMTRWMIKHLDASSLTEVGNLIGQIGEVNVPIHKGRTGEITYVVNSKRCNSPAKSANSNLEIERGEKVMIVDTDNHVMLVEPYRD
jgi:membrane-bound ClpP family serine protease